MAPLPKRRHSTRRQGKRTAAVVLKFRKKVEHTKTYLTSNSNEK